MHHSKQTKTAIAVPYAQVQSMAVKCQEILDLREAPQVWTGSVHPTEITVPTVLIVDLPDPDLDLRPFREKHEHIALVVMGDRPEHAQAAWALHAERYLPKNQMEMQLATAFRLAQKRLNMRATVRQALALGIGETIQLPVKGGAKVNLLSENILYFGAAGDYTWCYLRETPDAPLKIHWRLGRVEEQVRQFGYERIHRSTVVNSIFIEKRDAQRVWLMTGQVLAVGRDYH